MVALSDGEKKSENIFARFDTMHKWEMDRQAPHDSTAWYLTLFMLWSQVRYDTRRLRFRYDFATSVVASSFRSRVVSYSCELVTTALPVDCCSWCRFRVTWEMYCPALRCLFRGQEEVGFAFRVFDRLTVTVQTCCRCRGNSAQLK